MKKLIFLVLFFIIISNSFFSQIEVYIDTTKIESPNESWNVNKRYDKDGNIIQYDSFYSYSSNGEYLNIDSLISTFGINNFFSNPFIIDSAFNFFNQKSHIMDDIFKEFIQIDSFFNDLFDNNFSKPKPKKEKIGTHI
tara:strand:- start:173 stop:586 length:414 start_codon:yes stop_codon:yes gene_type:complete